MHASPTFELAQARMADLRRQARRESLARAAVRSAQPDQPRVPARLRLRLVRRHRAAPAAS